MHYISLRGPWNVVPIGNDAESNVLSAPQRVSLPADWQSLFGRRRGRVCFSRRFHLPTGLNASDRVSMTCANVGGKSTWRLNGHLLADYSQSASDVDLEITSQLQSFNLLEVEVEFTADSDDAAPGGLYDVIALAITTSPE